MMQLDELVTAVAEALCDDMNNAALLSICVDQAQVAVAAVLRALPENEAVREAAFGKTDSRTARRVLAAIAKLADDA